MSNKTKPWCRFKVLFIMLYAGLIQLEYKNIKRLL